MKMPSREEFEKLNREELEKISREHLMKIGLLSRSPILHHQIRKFITGWKREEKNMEHY